MSKPKDINKVLKKGVQLDMMSALFVDDTKLNNFIKNAINEFSNCKWLRVRLEYSGAKKIEKLACYSILSDVLEHCASLLYKMSRESTGYKHMTQDDFFNLLFHKQYEHPPVERTTLSELRSHHDSVISRISGMFFANAKLLSPYQRYKDEILSKLRESGIILQRLKQDAI